MDAILSTGIYYDGASILLNLQYYIMMVDIMLLHVMIVLLGGFILWYYIL